MNTASNTPRVEYSYSYQNNPPGGDTDSLVIKLRCPTISSFTWCLKLYSMVLGFLGIGLSFIWIFFHLYVCSQTSLQELRHQRYRVSHKKVYPIEANLEIIEFESLAYVSHTIG